MWRMQTQNTPFIAYIAEDTTDYRAKLSLVPEETATLHFTQHYANGKHLVRLIN